MTVFQIKLIAIIAMVVDHIGIFFFPDILWFRIVGRLAFPLFAWLIANGSYHSRNIKNYGLRLFTFALISQIPFYLVYTTIDPYFRALNIFFTLFFGFCAIVLTRMAKHNLSKILIVIFFSLIAQISSSDYGASGVLSIVAFYLYFNDLKMMFFAQFLIIIIFYIMSEGVLLLLTQGNTEYLNLGKIIQSFALLSLLVIYKHNGREGRPFKSFFYSFYPLHLFIIYVIKITFHI